jgi:hypothetical protein
MICRSNQAISSVFINEEPESLPDMAFIWLPRFSFHFVFIPPGYTPITRDEVPLSSN